MALIATKTGGDFKLTPQGNHLARCWRVIDLGTQTTTWQGKQKSARKVLFAWELHGEDEDGNAMLTDDGKPLSISSRYSLSLSDKASMRAMLEGWRGRAFTDEELSGFDISAVLGKWCMVNVVHTTKDGKTYDDVANVSAVPKALRQSLPEPANAEQFFDTSEPDMAVFDKLSERLQDTIRGCREWQKVSASQAAAQSAGASARDFDELDTF